MNLRHLIFPAAALLVFATGCSIVPEPKADPTRHYVLTAATQPADSAKQTEAKNKAFVAVRAIEMPAYLRGRKNIAIRQGTNEIVYHEYARWAEMLEDGVTRVVCERLLATGSVSGVALLPGRATRDCDLTIRVLECEGSLPAGGGTPAARFAAEYELTLPGGGAITGTRHFVAPAANWDGKDYSALATLLGQAISALADDVAQTLPAK